MPDEDAIERVSKISGELDGAKGLSKRTSPTPLEGGDAEKFSSFMDRKLETPVRTDPTAKATGVSPIDELANASSKIDNLAKWNPQKLVSQTDEAIRRMDEIKKTLDDPSLSVKKSLQNLLRKRLSSVEDNLKVALSKAGIEYTPFVEDTKPAGLADPIRKFVGYLTHGQDQLEKLSVKLHEMGLTGQEFSAANMLGLQIKVGRIQQELEFFTSLLNKALESTKTVMNVQV